MATFAERLKELRERVALSREELAQASRLSRGVIRDYEQGKRRPALESAFRLARALSVSVEAFADCADMADGQPEPKPRKATAAPRRTRGRKGKG
jgi:transcriptional regulator with XRE-family HTH domain